MNSGRSRPRAAGDTDPAAASAPEAPAPCAAGRRAWENRFSAGTASRCNRGSWRLVVDGVVSKKESPGLPPKESGGTRAGNRPNRRNEALERWHGAVPSRQAPRGKEPTGHRPGARAKRGNPGPMTPDFAEYREDGVHRFRLSRFRARPE